MLRLHPDPASLNPNNLAGFWRRCLDHQIFTAICDCISPGKLRGGSNIPGPRNDFLGFGVGTDMRQPQAMSVLT